MIRVLLVLAAAALASAAVATAVTVPKPHKCNTVVGAHWSMRGQSGSVYNVGVAGLSCSFARAVVPALTRADGHSGPHLAGTPKGFTCAPLIVPPKGRGVLDGLCAKGDNPANGSFSWSPVGLHLK
jgi:hypothetical protein